MSELYWLYRGLFEALDWHKAKNVDNILLGEAPVWTYPLGLFLVFVLICYFNYLAFIKIACNNSLKVVWSRIKLLKDFKTYWFHGLVFSLVIGGFIGFATDRMVKGLEGYQYFTHYQENPDILEVDWVTVKESYASHGGRYSRGHIWLTVETWEGQERNINVSDVEYGIISLFKRLEPEFQMPVIRRDDGVIVAIDDRFFEKYGK